MKNKPAFLPFTHALAWIVGSTFLISGSGHLFFKHYFNKQTLLTQDSPPFIRSIIQTGPQKEALKTEYLAELLGISIDRPPLAHRFDLKKAKEDLLSSPLITHADVKLIKPHTLYINYTVRQPIAFLEDFENVAIDKEGFLFPFAPFFSPKNLPSIYFGMAPFYTLPSDPDRPIAKWREPLQGKYAELAQQLFKHLLDPKVADLFCIKRIDVSNAFAESAGTREIILITEDQLVHQSNGQEVPFFFPRILRLSTKSYPQELGNYLILRCQLLEEEQKGIAHQAAPTRYPPKIIDFRIHHLAFIENSSSKKL